MGYGKVYCVFQPHTYTRAFKLKDDFAKSFGLCHEVIFADIYAAREKNTGLISSKKLADAVNEVSNNARYLGDFETICEYLLKEAKADDVVITMGAGDIYKVGDMLIEKCK